MTVNNHPPLTSSQLTEIWSDLNRRYFDGALPPIALVWMPFGPVRVVP